MNDSEIDRLRQWVAWWKAAGARMEELRREELRHTDTQQSLMSLADAFESCRLHYKPLPTSGFVEQQYWFQKLAKNSRRGAETCQEGPPREPAINPQ